VGHGKLFVASGLRRRVSQPHHICDTNLPDGAMELLGLAGGRARARARSRGRVGPIGISEAPPIFRIAGWPGRRGISEGGVGFRRPLWSTWLGAERPGVTSVRCKPGWPYVGSVTQGNRVQEAVSDNSKLCDSEALRRDRRFLIPSTRPGAPGNRVPWSQRRVRLIAPRADGLPRGRSAPWYSAGPTPAGQGLGRTSRGPAMMSKR
jgi:hypothetical protein